MCKKKTLNMDGSLYLQTLDLDRLKPAVFSWTGLDRDLNGTEGLSDPDPGSEPRRNWSRAEAEASIPQLAEFHKALESFVTGPHVSRINARHCVMFSSYHDESLAKQFMVISTFFIFWQKGTLPMLRFSIKVSS